MKAEGTVEAVVTAPTPLDAHQKFMEEHGERFTHITSIKLRVHIAGMGDTDRAWTVEAEGFLSEAV